MAHDVFISHSSKDKQIADAVCAGLEMAKIRCWIAPRDVLAGNSYPGEITRGIEGARVIVFVFSEFSNQSRAVHVELEMSFSRAKIIIPFRIENIVPSQDVAFLIASEHWLDAVSPPIEAHISELISIVQRQLGNPVEAPQAGPLPVIRRKLAISKRTWRWIGAGLLAAAILASCFLGYRSYVRSRSVILESPPDGAEIVGSDLVPLVSLHYHMPEGLDRKAEIQLRGEGGKDLQTISKSGSSYLLFEREGKLWWRVRASWTREGNEMIHGPWTQWRALTFYKNRLSKILHTHHCIIGTADLTPEDAMTNLNLSTNQSGGYEVELLESFFNEVCRKNGISGPVQIDNKSADTGWGDAYFHMLEHNPSVDVLVSGITPSPQREHEWGVSFSTPSMKFHQVLLVRKGTSALSGSQITVNMIGVADRTTNKDFLFRLFGQDSRKVYVDPGPDYYDSLVERLLNQSLDAILVDEVYLPTIFKHHAGLKEATSIVRLLPRDNPAFEESSAAYAFRTEDREFRIAMDDFLSAHADIQKKLQGKYFGAIGFQSE